MSGRPPLAARVAGAALRAIARLPASARAWIARRLSRGVSRRHHPPTSDQGA